MGVDIRVAERKHIEIIEKSTAFVGSEDGAFLGNINRKMKKFQPCDMACGGNWGFLRLFHFSM